jgi:hypothetical protein
VEGCWNRPESPARRAVSTLFVIEIVAAVRKAQRTSALRIELRRERRCTLARR